MSQESVSQTVIFINSQHLLVKKKLNEKLLWSIKSYFAEEIHHLLPNFSKLNHEYGGGFKVLVHFKSYYLSEGFLCVN